MVYIDGVFILIESIARSFKCATIHVRVLTCLSSHKIFAREIVSSIETTYSKMKPYRYQNNT